LLLTLCFTQVLVQKVNDFIRLAGGRNTDHGRCVIGTPAMAEELWKKDADTGTPTPA
jgi:hypothetical protein